jgi:eukaryotic-like serine/threonine-protein kinase
MSGEPRANLSRPRIFGPFAFDEASGELRKHGVRLRLQGQPLRILSLLLEQPGRPVRRDEFHQQLWSGSTFVDFEHGLNAAINRLRQVLGDSADHPRYIETLPGRGYRFIAAVEDADTKPMLVIAPRPSSEVDESPPAASTARQTRGKTWKIWLIAGGVLAFLAIVYLAVLRRPLSSLGPQLQFVISPPDGYALEAGSSRQTFALSPDGTRLAFSAMDASGIFQAFVRDLNALESRPLGNTIGSYHVFWAPDGRSLFLSLRGSLHRTALDGDSYQLLCDNPAILFTGVVVGTNLLMSAHAADYIVPLAGGTPQQTKRHYPWPQVLPNGKHLLHTVFDTKTGHHRVRVAEIDNPGSARDLLETDSRAMYAPSVVEPRTGYLIYVRAGNILAHPFDPDSLRLRGEPIGIVSRTYSFLPTGAADFSVSNNGMLAYRRYLSRSQLAWVTRRGEVVKTVGPANVNVKQGRLSPDGRKIAASIFDVNRGVNDMWIIDVETGTARRTIVGRGLTDNPVWAPDSKTLAFSRDDGRLPKLFVRGIGETDPEEPLPENFFQIPTDWSRDGRFIAFTNTSFAQVQNEMRGDVWLIDTARGRKPVHLIGTPFHEANPAFSPDGRWLAFTSNESGRTEVYVQAFEAGDSPRLVGERYLVSKHGAISIRWRPDGKELFYLGWDGRLYAVPISLSQRPKTGDPASLFAIDTEARAAIHSLSGFDVSPDGQHFLVPIVTSAERSAIVVMQNWEAAVKRDFAKVN